jgi:hypothetical protein
MATITRINTITITLKTQEAQDWIEDNISIPARQWHKNEDTGNLEFQIDSTFSAELIDAMAEDLQPDIDFSISKE